MTQMRIIGIGDNVCDKYRTISTMFPGGQALNVAVYCRLQGCFSAYMGVFGTDRVGNHIKETLTAVGVEFSRCRTYEGENGYAVVDLIDGDRSFVSSNKGGVLREHPLRLTASDLSYIDSFEVVHTSNNSYFDDQLPLLKPLVPLVSYDFSRSWEDIERRQVFCPVRILMRTAYAPCWNRYTRRGAGSPWQPWGAEEPWHGTEERWRITPQSLYRRWIR